MALSPLSPTTQQRSPFALVSIACILVIIGLVFIYSASSVFSLKKYGSAHYFVLKQAGGLLLALSCGLCASRLSRTTIKTYAPIGLLLSLCAALIPLLIRTFGQTIHGSTRWISIGGITVQPVEFLKIFLVPTSALCLCMPTRLTQPIRSIILLIIILAPCVLVLLAQPDFGQSLLIVTTTLCMGLIAYPTISYVGYFMSISATIITLLIMLKPYRIRRIIAFLSPWNDPQGAGFQMVQSLIAIGSGGIFGAGIGQSQQKFFYLPMQHTDFIFSIIGEETGLWGTSSIIILYIFFAYQGCKLAWRSSSLYDLLVLVGYTYMISIQAGINLAVTTGLAPTKGIGLPFISFGLSSLVAHGCIIGIMAALTRDANA